MAAVLVAAAVALAGLCAALSWAQVRRVAVVTALDPKDTASSLLRRAEGDRVAELSRRAPAASWEHRLAEELAEASGDAARVAAVNDALADLDLALEQGAGWPSAALRLSAFGGLLLAAVAYLLGRTDLIVAVIGIAAVGAVASADAGRRAKQLARKKREGIDALIAAVVGSEIASDGANARGRSRRKWREV